MTYLYGQCPYCGSNLIIVNMHEISVCPYCNKQFYTRQAIIPTDFNCNYQVNSEKQKAVNQNVNCSNNITCDNNQTSYTTQSRFEMEKGQCETLLMLLDKIDIKHIPDTAIKTLNSYPNNSLAKAIYDCKFSLGSGIYFLEQPLLDYLDSESGNIDLETCTAFVKVACYAVYNKHDTKLSTVINKILDNIDEKYTSGQDRANAYKVLAEIVGDKREINVLFNVAEETKKLKIPGIIAGDMHDYEREGMCYEIQAQDLIKTRKQLANEIEKRVDSLDVDMATKKDIFFHLAKVQTDNRDTCDWGKIAGGIFAIITMITIVVLFWINLF